MKYDDYEPLPPRVVYRSRSRYAHNAPPLDYDRDRSAPAPFSNPPASRRAPGPDAAVIPVDPNNVLGVFGLSIRTRERDLEDEFSRYGDVEKVVIVYDQRSDRSRGFGFITMKSTEDATRCIEKLNGVLIHGRAIRVDFSATRKPHQSTPGEYMGIKRPLIDERGRYDDRRGGGYDDRRGGGGGYPPSGRYDDRRGGGGYSGGGGRYDERERYDSRDSRDGYASRRRYDDDPYEGRSRRDPRDERRPSPPPRRRSNSPDRGEIPARRSRYSASPDRRPPPREYEATAPPAGESRY
ncbi:transformer-2 protein, partial [Tremellales sp. Uapishka_1]